MTDEQKQKVREYAHMLLAIADGAEWEARNQFGGDWFTPSSPAYTWNPDYIRLKPAEPAPVLGPEDVPPLSLIRRKGQTDEYKNPQDWHWRLISYVTGIGPVCADRGYNWQELSTDYEINRPCYRDSDGNPTKWEPCRKEAP